MKPQNSYAHLDLRLWQAKQTQAPKVIKQRSLASSITVKIFGLFLIVGLTPALASFWLFIKLSDFNQSLQNEAIQSIEQSSEFYRAWVKAEAQRIELIQESLRAGLESIVLKSQIYSVQQAAQDRAFHDEVMTLFTDKIRRHNLILELELSAEAGSILRVGHSPSSPAELKIRQISISVPLLQAQPSGLTSAATPRLTKLESLDGNWLVGLEAAENPAPTKLRLPERLPESAADIKSPAEQNPTEVTEALSITILFGLSRSLADRYEVLGERRHIHLSISEFENEDAIKLSSIYLRFFSFGFAAILALALIAAALLAYPLSRRISILTQVTQRVADGELDVQVEVKGSDQIAYLMQQFNAMVRELRAAQESQKYIERMQAWQEVARHLAHEIKNPLTPLLLAMQQLDRKFDDYRERPERYRRLVSDAVEIVNEEAATLQKLVREFSEFARLPVPEKKATVFWAFIQQCLQLNPQYAEEAKRITLHPPSPACAKREVNIDHELLRRVLINIIRNAIEAARNANIEAEIDIELRELHDNANQRDCLWLLILDNGPGLTAEQSEKIFTPYFTTKADGTGLGLAIVRKILEDHEGSIQIHNRDDGQTGAQVDIIL